MKRIRVIATGLAGETLVSDADSGEHIRNVRKVTFEHDAHGVPKITLEILCHNGVEVDVEAEATFKNFEIPDDGSALVSNPFEHHVLKGTGA